MTEYMIIPSDDKPSSGWNNNKDSDNSDWLEKIGDENDNVIRIMVVSNNHEDNITEWRTIW